MQLKERLNPFSKRVSPDYCPHQNRDVTLWELEDAIILYDPQTEQAHVLNQTAVAVWELCNGSRDAREIVGRVADSWGAAPEAVAPQVVETLEQLQQFRLVLGQTTSSRR